MLYTSDTTAEAEEVQLATMRTLTGQDRIRQTCILSNHLRHMAFAAIRKRFPEMDDFELKLTFIELTYGKDLAEALRNQASESSH